MKLGRKPAVRDALTIASKAALSKALAPLGPPPSTSNDYVSAVHRQSRGGWMMLGNDQYGDCVEADDGHYLMLRTANAGAILIPTTEEVLDLYGAETGFNPKDPATDQGTDETSDCRYMVSHGFLGHKADATATVAHADVNHWKWSIQLFGGCKFGINLPQSAMDQFNAGEPWAVVPDDGGILGGHDVLGVMYAANVFYVVTWGRLQPVEVPWLLKYTEEAHVTLFADWIRSNGASPSGFDLATLLSDLSKLSSSQSVSRQHRHHRRRWKHRPVAK